MGGLPEVESLRFAYWFDASYKTLGALALPNGEVVELGSRCLGIMGNNARPSLLPGPLGMLGLGLFGYALS